MTQSEPPTEILAEDIPREDTSTPLSQPATGSTQSPDSGSNDDEPENESTSPAPPAPVTPVHTLRPRPSRQHLGSTKLPVSLAFKRTCYKCGNLGHHADDCYYKVRLCYNCKKPGHESSQCPNDRNTQAKQCYFCKGIGHIQSECPEYKAIRNDTRYHHQHHQHNQHHHGHHHIPAAQLPQGPIVYYTPLRPLPGHTAPIFQHPQGTPPPQQFYYASPLSAYPRGYHPPPQPAPGPPPQPTAPLRGPPQPVPYYQGLMAQGDFVPPQAATEIYGNQLFMMRGFPPQRAGAMCYACGEHGHESKDCPRRM